MTGPTTPTGKRHYDRVQRVGYAWFKGDDIIAIEHEAAAAERERLEAEGWHAPEPDCGPIKALPHLHSYIWSDHGTLSNIPPRGLPCGGCGKPYDPEAPSDD